MSTRRSLAASIPIATFPGSGEVRGRLLTALGWAAGAFAAIAVSSSELARVLGPKLGGFGMSSAALCAVFASLGFMVVLRLARRLDAREHNGAQVLLLATVLVRGRSGSVRDALIAAYDSGKPWSQVKAEIERDAAMARALTLSTQMLVCAGPDRA